MRARAQLQATEDYAVSVFAVLRVPPPFTIEMMTFVRRLLLKLRASTLLGHPVFPDVQAREGSIKGQCDTQEYLCANLSTDSKDLSSDLRHDAVYARETSSSEW